MPLVIHRVQPGGDDPVQANLLFLPDQFGQGRKVQIGRVARCRFAQAPSESPDKASFGK